MKFLLDTHAFLWWLSDPEKLSSRAFETIEAAEHEIYLSPASSWEIAIKMRLGRLALPKDLSSYIPQKMLSNGFRSLGIEQIHALETYHLPDHHRDPFDRMLIAQARVEKMPIITKDALIEKYVIETVW